MLGSTTSIANGLTPRGGCRRSRPGCLGAVETSAALRSKPAAAPVDHGLAQSCRGHDEGTFGVQEGLAMLAHDSPSIDGLFQEFRSPKVPLSQEVLAMVNQLHVYRGRDS
jgi:hypothetical protein